MLANAGFDSYDILLHEIQASCHTSSILDVRIYSNKKQLLTASKIQWKFYIMAYYYNLNTLEITNKEHWGMGHAVVQALCHKPEGHRFDSMGFFIDVRNPSDCNMAVRSTQPITEMSTRDIS